MEEGGRLELRASIESLKCSFSPLNEQFSSDNNFIVSVILLNFCINSLLRFGLIDAIVDAGRPFVYPLENLYGDPGPSNCDWVLPELLTDLVNYKEKKIFNYVQTIKQDFFKNRYNFYDLRT